MNKSSPRRRMHCLDRAGLIVTLLTIMLALSSPFSGIAAFVHASGSSHDLTVYFLDVGQGDATLLAGPDFMIMIDAGRHDRRDVVPHLKTVGVKRLDLLVGTHPHADHIGQFAQVLDAFPVTEVWLPGNIHTSRTYERALDAILATDASYHEPRAGETYRIGSAFIEVLHPARLTNHFNNDSIVLRISYQNVQFLFTGDAERAAESEMLERQPDTSLRAHVLHIGHHGSRTSSTAPFLKAVAAEIGIYSAGMNNAYGHPHPEVLTRLKEAGMTVYGTDVNGTVRVSTDGNTIWVSPRRGKAIVTP